MKRMLVIPVLIVSIAGFAQSAKYKEAMKKQLSLFDSAKTTQDLVALSNAFARIGDAEKTQWLPYYYAGLALTTVGWMDAGVDKDANAEKISELSAKAEGLTSDPADKSELCALRNMAATQHMMVDPQNRWQTYGQEANAALEEGKKLNANNPRMFYLQGMSIFNTPEQFGGGKANAKPIFEQAVNLYKKEKAKPLYPDWGKKEADDMLSKCQ